MAGEALEFFTEFLFGSGAWLGLILIVAISLLVVAKVKYSSIAFFVIFAFLGVEYLNNVPASSNLMWCAVIVWALIPVLFFLEFKRKD